MKLPKEVDALCAKIEADLTNLAKASRDALSKVHPGEDTMAETPPDMSATSPSGPPDASAPPPPADGGSPPSDAPPGEDGGDQPMTHEQMVQALQALPPDQLQAWMAAADEVRSAMGGADAGGAPPMDGGSPPPADDGSAMKSEDLTKVSETLRKAEAGLAEQESVIVKLQTALKDTNARLAKQESDLAETGKVFQTWLRSPDRKGNLRLPAEAPKSVDPLATLSKSEIGEKLRVVCKTKPVTHAQRKAVNRYLTSGEGADEIRPLLA